MRTIKQIIFEEYMKRKLHPYRVVLEVLLLIAMLYGVLYVKVAFLGAGLSLLLLLVYVACVSYQDERNELPEINCFVPRNGSGMREYVAYKSNLAAGCISGTVFCLLSISCYMDDNVIWNLDIGTLIGYIGVGIFAVAKEGTAARWNAIYRKKTMVAYRKHTSTWKYRFCLFGMTGWVVTTVILAWSVLSEYQAETVSYTDTEWLGWRWKLVMCVVMVAELLVTRALSNYQYRMAELGDYDNRVSKDEVLYEY